MTTKKAGSGKATKTAAKKTAAKKTAAKKTAAKAGSAAAPKKPRARKAAKDPFSVGDKVVYPHHGAAMEPLREIVMYRIETHLCPPANTEREPVS